MKSSAIDTIFKLYMSFYSLEIPAKAKLLQEGIFFLIHLFARGISNEKVGNRKN